MLKTKIEKAIEELVTKNATPGVNYAIIADDEKIVGSLGLKGKYDIENGEIIIKEEKNDIDTLYDLASLTKVISTVTIIFRLIEKNVLNIDDKVSKFLPRFKYDDITIYDVLTHTSGLPADYRTKDIITYDEALGKLFSSDKETEKGVFVYSDLDYILLGLIIEKVCNKKLDIVFEEEVAIPLEMSSTGFKPKNKKNVAPTEITKNRGLVCGFVHDEKAFSMNGVAGHAGLFSNVNDLTNFCKMILNDGIYNGKKYLEKNTIDIWFHPLVDNDQFKRSFSWFVGDNPNVIEGENSISFSGFTGPSISIDREKNVAIVLLANRVHPTRDNSLIKYLRGEISSNIYKCLEKDFLIKK